MGVCIWGSTSGGGGSVSVGFGQTPDPPAPPKLEKQAVHILLKYFIVLSLNSSKSFKKNPMSYTYINESTNINMKLLPTQFCARL